MERYSRPTESSFRDIRQRDAVAFWAHCISSTTDERILPRIFMTYDINNVAERAGLKHCMVERECRRFLRRGWVIDYLLTAFASAWEARFSR